MKRIFIGIFLPETFQESLSSLCFGVSGMKWTKPENLHITLKFIGEVENRLFEEISESLYDAKFKPFIVKVKGIGTFQNKFNQLIWAGLEQSEEILELYKKIEKMLSKFGIPKEKREYLPHVTLGRGKNVRQEKIQEYTMLHNDFFLPIPIVVESFQLISSNLKPSGSVYTIENEYPAII